jgi:hypothetical protein
LFDVVGQMALDCCAGLYSYLLPLLCVLLFDPQVDRNTITIGTCDVNLSFGAHPAEIPGIVRFLHPLHNFSLVAYSPVALPEKARAKIRAAQVGGKT